MNETRAGTPLTEGQVEEVSGGGRAADDLREALERLKASHEALLDAASRVIERSAD